MPACEVMAWSLRRFLEHAVTWKTKGYRAGSTALLPASDTLHPEAEQG